MNQHADQADHPRLPERTYVYRGYLIRPSGYGFRKWEVATIDTRNIPIPGSGQRSIKKCEAWIDRHIDRHEAGTCDWGYCSGEAVGARYSHDYRGWLPVCTHHLPT